MSKSDKRRSVGGGRQPISRQQICLPVAPLHQSPDPLSSLDSQLIFGAAVDVYSKEGDWVWVQEVQKDKAGYVGYVPKLALAQTSFEPSHGVIVLKAPVFTRPDLKSPIRYILPLNAKLKISQSNEKYLYAEDVGYIHAHHVSKLSDQSGDFTRIAEQHLGLPYIWGGVSTDGLDCSGLVQSSLRAVGRDAPRDSDMQEQALGTTIDPKNGLQRGDLVFWKGHVGILTDSDTLLHANAHHMAVVSEPLNEATQRIEKTAGSITSIKRMT